MHDAIRRRLIMLESKAPARDAMTQERAKRIVSERIIESQQGRARYEAMSTPEKIAHKQRELADREQTPCNELFNNAWRELGCRMLKNDIEELQGADPAVIEAQRTADNEWFRGSRGKRI